MPTPGYVFKDGQPIPDNDAPGQPRQMGSEAQSKEDTVTDNVATSTLQADNSPALATTNPSKLSYGIDAPTESHALAFGHDAEIKGAAQEHHYENEVKDLGWNDHPDNVPKPLVGGLQNEDLWLLVRRFNRQIYHVRSTKEQLIGGLDLVTADDEEFTPDKLRANLERLYMTIIIGLMTFGKHIARLRSWREPRRTSIFLATYAVAWVFDFVMPLILVTVIGLIVCPRSRLVLFPPAPLALVDSKTGGVQSPAAGVLGSHDSATGAPENHRGEAVEQEAQNFVAGFATIAMSSAAGKHEPADPSHDTVNASVPDPTDLATTAIDAQTSAKGGKTSSAHDKTKQPVQDAMWTKMRPIMRILADMADTWERFANALSPTPPFPRRIHRLKIGSILLPLLLISTITSSYMFMKANTFIVGFGFFGDPIIWRGLSFLNRKFPKWQKLLEIQNTILRGVPTNAQLAITLQRIGEANMAPIPPPPSSDDPPEHEAADLDTEDLTLDASHAEIQDAITPDANATADDPDDEKAKKKHGSRVLGFLKGTTRLGVEAKLGADKIKAAVGSSTAKNHRGVLPKRESDSTGPVDFEARYKGKKGWIYINTSATIPCVSYSNKPAEESLEPIFSIPIAEITEIKKVGGLGWKSKLLVGWSISDRKVIDGIEILDKNGFKVHMTAIKLRDELFNRLASMGPQKWESL